MRKFSDKSVATNENSKPNSGHNHTTEKISTSNSLSLFLSFLWVKSCRAYAPFPMQRPPHKWTWSQRTELPKQDWHTSKPNWTEQTQNTQTRTQTLGRGTRWGNGAWAALPFQRDTCLPNRKIWHPINTEEIPGSWLGALCWNTICWHRLEDWHIHTHKWRPKSKHTHTHTHTQTHRQRHNHAHCHHATHTRWLLEGGTWGAPPSKALETGPFVRLAFSPKNSAHLRVLMGLFSNINTIEVVTFIF